MEESGMETPIRFEDLKRKMKFDGKVIKTSLAGAIVDVGIEVPGVVHISQLQEEPVNRVDDVIEIGQTVTVWVRRVDENKKRVELTMIEPLPLEWREIKKDMVVKGTVTRLERYGAFVEIGAERPGLVHISELTHGYIRTPSEVIHEGDEVEVKILRVNRRKKQIKLSMKALESIPTKEAPEEKVEEDSEKEELVPTAMEQAYRDAMEKAQQKENGEEVEGAAPAVAHKQESSSNPELDDILSHSLDERMRSTTE